ncbi:MAG: threonine synthase [Gemmatimonadales bacterium]|nr:threonine synthase [Gemmatimonadales bacterium]
MDWILECSAACGRTASPAGLPGTCPGCGQPWFVRYPARRPSLQQRADIRRRHGLWKWRAFLPIMPHEQPVSLGEGDTPLLRLRRTGERLGFSNLWLKDEGLNATGSFKARGLSSAVTRATLAGVTRFTLPTAGNAGVAASAYASRAGAQARVWAPRTTPRTILAQVLVYGGDLQLLDGHIGDCGKASRAWAAETGAYDIATLREPYRVEGKKTMGLELALDFDWTLPDVVIYPTGGGEGLIGMWKAFAELREAGWVSGPLPRMVSVQSSGCAPVVRAFEAGADHAEPWADPWTLASGLRVPGPLGDRLMLRALRESGGAAVAIDDPVLLRHAREVSAAEGIDLSPEGGAAIAAAIALRERGLLHAHERIVLFNTGAGWLYREAQDLLGAP